MSRELVIKCSFCKEAMVNPKLVTLNDEEIHLCSAECWLKMMGRAWPESQEIHIFTVIKRKEVLQ